MLVRANQRFVFKLNHNLGRQISPLRPYFGKLNSKVGQVPVRMFCEPADNKEYIRKRTFKTEKQEEAYIGIVKENALDMDNKNIPKGVKFSSMLLVAPITLMVGSLVMTQFTSPVEFSITARTCLRLLNLNIAFNGGVHYGIGGALYEIASLEHLRKAAKRQVIYSFIPGISSYIITYWMLLADPLSITVLTTGFASLGIIQTASYIHDRRFVKAEALPKWYTKMRTITFTYLLVVTATLFAAMFTKLDLVQKSNENDRISTLQRLLKLDDVEFLEEVNRLGLEYNEEDMKILQGRLEKREARAKFA